MGAPRIDRLDKNLLINGNFDYWQRGTLISTISSFGADRWKGNSAQASQQRRDRSFSAGLPTGSLYGNQVTSLAGGNELFQRIESARLAPYVGKYLTFSFKAGLVSGTTQLSINIRKPTVTDNYASSAVILGGSNFVAPAAHSGTYSQYSFTFPVDQDMADKGFAVSIQGDASVWSIIFAQMMVVASESSSGLIPLNYSYSGRDLTQELQLCQRYYEKSYDLDVAPGSTSDSGRIAFHSATGIAAMSNLSWFSFEFKTTKRAIPVVVPYASSAVNQPNRFSDASGTTRICSASEVGVNRWSWKHGDPSSTTGVFMHYTADAEL